MNPITQLTTGRPTRPHSQTGMPIDFNDLHANDVLLIGTQNTRYRFVVDCEKEMRGRLSMDLSGSALFDAVLIGSMGREMEDLHLRISRLEPQSQALFFVQQGDKILKVLTSMITSLCCIRAARK
jgi:hypothetical protein